MPERGSCWRRLDTRSWRTETWTWIRRRISSGRGSYSVSLRLGTCFFVQARFPQIYFKKLACFSPPQNHHQFTTFLPATNHVFSTQIPRKTPIFSKTPPKNTTTEKKCEYQESLTQPPERDTLFKFGAVSHVSSSQGVQERQVCPTSMRPMQHNLLEESGQRSTAPRLRF